MCLHPATSVHVSLWAYLIYMYRLHRLCPWYFWERREKGGAREKIWEEQYAKKVRRNRKRQPGRFWGERGGSEILGGHLGEGRSRGEEESEKTGSDIHR